LIEEDFRINAPTDRLLVGPALRLVVHEYAVIRIFAFQLVETATKPIESAPPLLAQFPSRPRQLFQSQIGCLR
jgi:hypothetical protein